MKNSMFLRSYDPMCFYMSDLASCIRKLPRQAPSLSPYTSITQSIVDIIICVFMYKLPPKVWYCCSYGLAYIDPTMMSSRTNRRQAITLSITVLSRWLLLIIVARDVIWIWKSRGDVGVPLRPILPYHPLWPFPHQCQKFATTNSGPLTGK